jgi:AAA family ATP:ADP antiporter
MTVATSTPTPHRGTLDRLLAPFVDARAGEAGTALLLMLNVFVLLTCYYILKPVREALILSSTGGAEAKSYASAVMVVLLIFFVPAYSSFASRVSRIRLITGVSLFFIACLVGFYLLAQVKVPYLGIAFFVWMGIFNVAIIAQFWSFANDVYTEEQGKRLFAIIAFGSTLGAILGSSVAKLLIQPLGVYQLMLVAAVLLGVSNLISRTVDQRERHRAPREAAEPTPDTGDGFRIVLRDRYLLGIALLMCVLNFVNTNGEYILGRTLSSIAEADVRAGLNGATPASDYKQTVIGSYYAGFLTWVNVVAALVQLFVVSRFLKWFGVRKALFVMPLISLGGYAIMAVMPVLSIIRAVKVAENATDYSLQNTTRQALFLPTSREAKYKAKSAIDTFFFRSGDVLSAGLVFVGSMIALAPKAFAAINVVLVIAWLVIAVWIGREHRKLTHT